MPERPALPPSPFWPGRPVPLGGGAGGGGVGAGGGFPGAGLTSYTRPTSSFEPETGGRPTSLRAGVLNAVRATRSHLPDGNRDGRFGDADVAGRHAGARQGGQADKDVDPRPRRRSVATRPTEGPVGSGATAPGSLPLRAHRPGPGGPAKAWAISSQRCASAPCAVMSRALSGRRWVTRKQKSSAEPVTRWAASGGPQDQVSPPGPRSSTRNGSVGGSQIVDEERVIAGAHPQMRDRPQSLGGGPFDAKGVGDVKPVRPGLHQPRGSHRRRAHRRPEPRQFAALGNRQQRVVQPAAGDPPVGEQLGRRYGRQFLGARVDEADRIRRRGGQHFGEPRLVGDRGQGDPVGPQQVPDLVGDGPARRRRRIGPALGGKWRHQRVEVVAFGTQVGHDRPGIPPSLPPTVPSGNPCTLAIVRRLAAPAEEAVHDQPDQVQRRPEQHERRRVPVVGNQRSRPP